VEKEGSEETHDYKLTIHTQFARTTDEAREGDFLKKSINVEIADE
jgi:hypothetical protein